MLSRLTLWDNNRDLYSALGYKREPNIKDFLFKYRRQDIAQRIVDAYPAAIWSSPPRITDNPDDHNITDFEKQFNEYAGKLGLFSKLLTVDKLAGLGRFAVLVFGLDDGLKLSMPVNFSRNVRVIYVMPFSEEDVTIDSIEEDSGNKRFGKPVMYKIDLEEGKGRRVSVDVHHSRLVHIAEGALRGDIYGIPRLEAIYNRLDDMDKVVGGASEIFFLNGRGGLHLNADKEADLLNAEEVKKDAAQYTQKLSRIIATKGIEVKTLDFNVHNPSGHVSVLLDIIAGATGIPQRILTGSERGELASRQDRNNWFSRVTERQYNHCEPRMIRPVVDYLIMLGLLPEKEYFVLWQNDSEHSVDERSSIAVKQANALSLYANSPEAQAIVPPQQFVEEVLSMEYSPSESGGISAGVEKQLPEIKEED